MEIDITDFFNAASPRDYSASVAEIGQDAGAVTWKAACDDAPDYPLLDTEEKRDAFRDHVRGFGEWDDAEIASWSDNDLTALFLQIISGDICDTGMSPEAFDWSEYEKGAERGTYNSRLYCGDDRHVYYYLGY